MNTVSNTEFKELYNEYIQREGNKELLDYLYDSDFFIAPASTRFHLAEEGGLCLHSLNVFYQLMRLTNAYPQAMTINNTTSESIAIVSLLHDLCKIGCYKIDYRNAKDENGHWYKAPFYKFEEDFAFGGHGSKSVYLIQSFMKLTPEEAVAINCHMSAFDKPCSDWSLGNAFEQYPLALLLSWADQAASWIDERRTA